MADVANQKGGLICDSPLIKEGGAVDALALNKLLERAGGLEASNSTKMENLSQINGGNPLTVKLFDTVADTTNDLDKFTSQYWQVVYRTGNVLTLWMTAPYTDSELNNSASKGTDYANSDIHKLIITTYNTLNSMFNLNAKNFISTPNELPVKWQTDETKQLDETQWDTNDNTYSAQNNLMNDGLENDKLWLSSFAEVFNNSKANYITNYGNLSVRNGIWQTNYQDRSYVINTISRNVLLRSAFSDTSKGAGTGLIRWEGLNISDHIASTNGVRPALHLNLESVVANGPQLNVSVDRSEDSGASLRVNGGSNASSYVGGIRSIPMQIDFTASPGYTINSVTLNGTALDLAATSATGVEYVAEYSKDKRTLTLTLTSILQDCNIVAKSGTTPCVIEVYNYPIAGGTVTGAGSYTYGAEVTLTAVAAAGYRFDAWFCDGVYVSDTTYTFTARKDIVIMAMFHKLGNYHINDSP